MTTTFLSTASLRADWRYSDTYSQYTFSTVKKVLAKCTEVVSSLR